MECGGAWRIYLITFEILLQAQVSSSVFSTHDIRYELHGDHTAEWTGNEAAIKYIKPWSGESENSYLKCSVSPLGPAHGQISVISANFRLSSRRRIHSIYADRLGDECYI